MTIERCEFTMDALHHKKKTVYETVCKIQIVPGFARNVNFQSLLIFSLLIS